MSDATPRDYSAERDAEIIPVAREILRILGSHSDIPMGNASQDDAEGTAKFFQKVYREELIPFLIEKNVKLRDITYAFLLATTGIKSLMDITQESFRINTDIANAKLWGVEDYDDLRVSELDAKLKEPYVDNNATPKEEEAV